MIRQFLSELRERNMTPRDTQLINKNDEIKSLSLNFD